MIFLELIHIMWTHTVDCEISTKWQPNHFVPCYIKAKNTFKVFKTTLN